MTASTTPCCASVPERILRALLVLLLCCWVPAIALAEDGAGVRHAEVVAGEDGYVLNAEFDFELNSRLAEAVNRGVALHFVTEFVVHSPRWYWFDEVVVERRLNYRLSYHAITRSYRLSIGAFHQSFDSMEGALRTMQRVRNWSVADHEQLVAGQTYKAALRFRLDTAQLPRPFQVTAIGSRDWQLSTEWSEWTFHGGEAEGE